MNIEIEELAIIDHWLSPERLSGERCDAIVAECERAHQEHIRYTFMEGGVEKLGRNVHAATVRAPWISSMAARYAAIANEKCGWHLRYDRVEIMYCVYGEGQFCGWHSDGYGIDLPGNRRRNLSVGVQLSDRGEYEGGEFELERVTDPNACPRSIHVSGFSQKGSVIAFPGDVFHQITPVTHGVRRSLVVWFCGPARGDES
jgi:PKHD-type hydroxylase